MTAFPLWFSMPQIYRFDKDSDKYLARDGKAGDSNGFSWGYLVLCAVGLATIASTFAIGYFKTSASASKPATPAGNPLDINLPAARKFQPEFGKIRLGAFSGEICDICGLNGQSISTLCQPANYAKYRRMVREVYGLDLEDMNYFSVGTIGWVKSIPKLRDWIMMAGKYGDVTIALEPMGFYQYDEFAESREMLALRKVFREAKNEGICIWIRYASEANLQHNPYTAGIRDRDASTYYQGAKWLKSFMPSNVKLVFSPLINTVVKGKKTQFRIIRRMLYGCDDQKGPLPWDRIGGTIYRTDLALEPTFNEYYSYMSQLAPDLPFQICELGGPYPRRTEMMQFLMDLKRGRWPRVEKVNLFARDINKRADPNGSFGFINPHTRAQAASRAKKQGSPVLADSWLKEVITSR